MTTKYEINSTNIKICGIKKIETIEFLVSNKVNYYGLIFYEKSPRYIDLVNAKSLIKISQNTNLNAVGVFVNFEINKIQNYIKKLNLKFIQLHGNENENYIYEIKKNHDIIIIKSISINNIKDLEKIKMLDLVDYFLFDYKPININDLPGGNAKKFNWNILNNVKLSKKWFLSGGINENNVKDAINLLNPYGVDISSSVEDKPGEKNHKKISNLLKVIKNINEY